MQETASSKPFSAIEIRFLVDSIGIDLKSTGDADTIAALQARLDSGELIVIDITSDKSGYHNGDGTAGPLVMLANAGDADKRPNHIAHAIAVTSGMVSENDAPPRGDAFIVGIDRKTGRLLPVLPIRQSAALIFTFDIGTNMMREEGLWLLDLSGCDCAVCNQRRERIERGEQRDFGMARLVRK